MDFVSTYQPIGVSSSPTSYFSSPAAELDPHLFMGDRLRPWVRNGVLNLLFDHLGRRYNSPHRWTTAWLAGSGVSFQWEATRIPGDLDCLVGIDYVKFREANRDYAGLSDTEISKMFNEGFNEDLMPNTANWYGYELTFYVNPGATDIRSINPYAAYNLSDDTWTVHPSANPGVPHTRAWAVQADRDYERASQIARDYSKALTDLRAASNPAYRVNAEVRLKHTVDAGVALFDEIHSGRKVAFSPTGGGYADYNNFRWQAGKASGAIGALRMLKDYRDEVSKSDEANTYGLELPDSSTLIRRAATYRRT